MWRAIRFIFVVLICAAGQIAPGLAQGSTQNPTVATALVTQIDNARVRRAGWTAFSRLSLGSTLQFGDLIDPEGKSIRVLCPDLSERVITKLGPLPCNKQRVVLHINGVNVAGWQRGQTIDPSIPYLISPRATHVLTAFPTIRWNAIGDADGYRITVRGDGLDWTTQVEGGKVSSLVYPKTAPPLQSETAYTIQITALNEGTDGPSSLEDNTPGLSFQVVSSADAATIQGTVSQIRHSISDKRLADLAVATYEAQSQLYADSLELLYLLVGNLSNPSQKIPSNTLQASPIPYMRIADIYLQSSLTPLAVAGYQRALSLVQGSDDIESQAIALVGLARASGSAPEQAKYAQQALAAWQKLGAQNQIDAMRQEFQNVLPKLTTF